MKRGTSAQVIIDLHDVCLSALSVKFCLVCQFLDVGR